MEHSSHHNSLSSLDLRSGFFLIPILRALPLFLCSILLMRAKKISSKPSISSPTNVLKDAGLLKQSQKVRNSCSKPIPSLPLPLFTAFLENTTDVPSFKIMHKGLVNTPSGSTEGALKIPLWLDKHSLNPSTGSLPLEGDGEEEIGPHRRNKGGEPYLGNWLACSYRYFLKKKLGELKPKSTPYKPHV